MSPCKYMERPQIAKYHLQDLLTPRFQCDVIVGEMRGQHGAQSNDAPRHNLPYLSSLNHLCYAISGKR